VVNLAGHAAEAARLQYVLETKLHELKGLIPVAQQQKKRLSSSFDGSVSAGGSSAGGLDGRGNPSPAQPPGSPTAAALEAEAAAELDAAIVAAAPAAQVAFGEGLACWDEVLRLAYKAYSGLQAVRAAQAALAREVDGSSRNHVLLRQQSSSPSSSRGSRGSCSSSSSNNSNSNSNSGGGRDISPRANASGYLARHFGNLSPRETSPRARASTSSTPAKTTRSGLTARADNTGSSSSSSSSSKSAPRSELEALCDGALQESLVMVGGWVVEAQGLAAAASGSANAVQLEASRTFRELGGGPLKRMLQPSSGSNSEKQMVKQENGEGEEEEDGDPVLSQAARQRVVVPVGAVPGAVLRVMLSVDGGTPQVSYA
jgi:hypothetical protein